VNSLKPKAVENLLRKATESLKGNSRRTFMAQALKPMALAGKIGPKRIYDGTGEPSEKGSRN